MDRQNVNGLTLMEIAIVLMVIALLIGAVLVGKDLVHAAAVRADLASIDKYQAAINTFDQKYNGLPGDFNKVGILAGVPAGHYGNGNGKLDFAYGTSAESSYFWEHLSKAGLIEGAYDGNPNASSSLSCGQSTCPPSKVNPSDTLFFGPLCGGGGVLAYLGACPVYNTGQDSTTYGFFWLNAAGTYTSGINVHDARALDSKVDDGIADTGNFIAINDNWGASGCVTGRYNATDGSVNYNASDTNNDCLVFHIAR